MADVTLKIYAENSGMCVNIDRTFRDAIKVVLNVCVCPWVIGTCMVIAIFVRE